MIWSVSASISKTARYADAADHPDCSAGADAAQAPVIAAANDRASAKKANPADEALDQPARVTPGMICSSFEPE